MPFPLRPPLLSEHVNRHDTERLKARKTGPYGILTVRASPWTRSVPDPSPRLSPTFATTATRRHVLLRCHREQTNQEDVIIESTRLEGEKEVIEKIKMAELRTRPECTPLGRP